MLEPSTSMPSWASNSTDHPQGNEVTSPNSSDGRQVPRDHPRAVATEQAKPPPHHSDTVVSLIQVRQSHYPKAKGCGGRRLIVVCPHQARSGSAFASECEQMARNATLPEGSPPRLLGVVERNFHLGGYVPESFQSALVTGLAVLQASSTAKRSVAKAAATPIIETP